MKTLEECQREVRQSAGFLRFLAEKLAESDLEPPQAPFEEFQAWLEEAVAEFTLDRPPLTKQELAVYEEDVRVLYTAPAHRPAGTPLENLLLRESVLAPAARCLEDLVTAGGAIRAGSEPRAEGAAVAAEAAARCTILAATTEAYYSSGERPERARQSALAAGNRAGIDAVREQLAWLAEDA